MEGKRFAGLVACVLLLGLGLALRPAGAIEFSLGDEQRVEIHGFYESQFRFVGEDAPFNGLTFSQFRHLLNIETDVDIFPDGKGPFDTMNAFTRWLIAYECVYSHACGIWGSADSYGNRGHRLPQEYKTARTPTPFAGGVIRQYNKPGTNLSTRERTNPKNRFNKPVNPPGRQSAATGFPLSVFANLNIRTELDDVFRRRTIDLGASNLVRTGSFHDPGDRTEKLLRFGKAEVTGLIGEERFKALDWEPIALPFEQHKLGFVRALQAEQIRDPERTDELQTMIDSLRFESKQELTDQPGFQLETHGEASCLREQ